MMSHYISLDDTEDTDTDKQITAQKEKQSGMHNQPWITLDPSGTCQSMRVPVKPKQSACARGHSERVLHSEGTDGSLFSQQVLPKDLDRHSSFPQCVQRAAAWGKTPLTRQRYKADKGKGRDSSKKKKGVKKTRKGTSKAPLLHNNLSGEKDVSLISFNSTEATAVRSPVQYLA